MSQSEHREIIRDDYCYKHYEVIRLGGDTFVFDYGLRRFLKGKEAAVLQENLQLVFSGVFDNV